VTRRSVRLREQESEVGGPDLFVGVESEPVHHRDGRLAECRDGLGGVAGGFDRSIALDFDLDELAESVDSIECDDTVVDRVACSFLPDSRGRFVAEAVENRPDRCLVVDPGFGFLAGFRLVVDQRSLVREKHPAIAVRTTFPADPEGLVGPGELAVGCIEVRVLLGDRPERGRTDLVETLADAIVIPANLQLYLVHAPPSVWLDKNSPAPGQHRESDASSGRAAGPGRGSLW
jgi:hypothetical protein